MNATRRNLARVSGELYILARQWKVALRGVVASFAIAAVGLALSTSPVSAQAPPVERQVPPALYVALGDSVTVGTGATPGDGYVDLLFAHYQSTLGVSHLSNRAKGSESSGSLRTGGQLESALADINGTDDTRVVTLGIGGIDALTVCDFTSPTCAFRTNFSATLVDLQAALADDPGEEPLIVLAYFNPNVGKPSEATSDRRLLGASAQLGCADTGVELGLNDIIAQEAATHDAFVADAYPAFKAAGQAYMADNIHPNDAGHAAIAEAFRTAAAPCAADRALTLDANKNKVKKKKKVGLSGHLESAEQACEASQTVELQRKRPSQATFTTFAQLQTDAEGNFSLKKKLKKTTEFRVQVPETAACDDGLSNTEKVKVKKKK